MNLRTSPLWLLLAAGLALGGCNCSEPVDELYPDASAVRCELSCDAGSTCVAVTGPGADASLACVPTLREGQVCGEAAGGSPVEGVCESGLSCGPVGALERCSRDCTAADAAEVCGAARQCFARPGGAGGAGFCGTAAGKGQACGDAELRKCTGSSLVCLNAGGDTLGKCFRLCDSTAADPNPACEAGESCADLFPDDPALGVCVVPVAGYPARCDYATLDYCGRGEAGVRPGEGSWGYCHDRCGTSADCAGGQQCASPSAGLQICVSPVARCDGSDPSACPECAAASDEYCGPGDICVRLAKETVEYLVCKQDCTATKTCARGTCSALTGTDRFACLE